MTFSVAIIIPAALREKANAVSVAMGYGPGAYGSPLSPNGNGPATHYGLHTAATDGFIAMLQGAGQGVLPDIPWADHGLTEDDVWAVLGAMKTKVAPYNPQTYWDLVAEQGLQLIEPATPLGTK